ncbi:MAG TPA: zinc-dependent alcohol dehydrogenase family protein [Planctomycetota bacterium]|nr:zinc-dependent alcohol dehydrogenase family protein [Planctomycetota bacterium]HRR80644.1 zinc-dependent alcohol dehydrogenase family protein [Planctomycetota bacterium]HRT96231.1 zinc-dependent alcohol dehydrogenase family protein [Planctomycetota bacterium]
MRAAYYEAFAAPLTIRDLPDPSPGTDGAVIRVRANGICRSDWHAWMGHDPEVKLPHVPGHELAGVVEAVGSGVRRWRQGDRVTVPFVCACGECPQCASGNQQVCDHQFQPGFTHWGSFAQFVAIGRADANLVRLPEELDFVTAASLGCRFATAFRALVAQGRVRPGQWVAVHGCGGVGLSAVLIASALGAQVVGVDIAEEKLRLARHLGAAETVNALDTTDVAQAVADLTRGGAHVSLDALGSPATCHNSIACLRKRGRHVQVGLLLAEQRAPQVPMDLVVARELEILGSHGMQAHEYGCMLAMITSHKLDPARLIGRTVTLEESLRELETMDTFAGTGVVVIDRF